jgi:FAD synthase
MTEENDKKSSSLVPGVYSAVASLKGRKYRAAVSIGWNPTYDNAKRTIEAYLLHDFGGKDFYGE